jgi:predicted HTH transcriptional regulator
MTPSDACPSEAVRHKYETTVAGGIEAAPDKGDPMINHKRHKRLLKLLDEREHASVQQLMEWLSASAATVRRDISWLAAKNQLAGAKEKVLHAVERDFSKQCPAEYCGQTRHRPLCHLDVQ